MTFPTRTTALICLIGALVCGFPVLSIAVEDAIIAVVNDELITFKDLKDYAQAAYASLVAEGASQRKIEEVMADMDKNGLTKLIEDKLILSNANKLQLEVREQLVDERIKQLEEKYGSEQNLIDALVRSGSTLTDLRNKIRDEMKIKFVVDHEVKSKIYINPQEVTDYYEQNKDRFGRKDRVNLESIFIAYGKDKDAALKKAEEALEQVREGRDFKAVAEEFSEMPSVGVVERGEALPAIEETVFDLNVDEVSPLVEIETGIYIFKAVGKTSAETHKIEEVKDMIYDEIYKEKFKKRFMDWLTKLKDEAYIEIK